MDKQFALSPTYLKSFQQLDSKSQKMVQTSMDLMYREEKSYGLQIHRVEKVRCDKSFRSARVNDDIRIIFSQDGEKFIFLYVDHHDDAYKWAENKFLERTEFGSLYIMDYSLQEKKADALDEIAITQQSSESILNMIGISKKHLVKIGIPEVHANNLMKIDNQDTFMDYITFLPEEFGEALMQLLLGEKSIEEIYFDLVDEEYMNSSRDTKASLNQKDTKRRFFIVEDEEQLHRILQDDSFEQWKLFLHPKQDFLVKQDFKGPVLVEGGPGTGKTVVAIHRALNLVEKGIKENRVPNVLLCTFSKKLSGNIESLLGQLAKSKGIDEKLVDVRGVDQLLISIYRKLENRFEYVTDEKINKLYQDAYELSGCTEKLEFLIDEYRQIVQRYNIKTIKEYKAIQRTGRGKALNEFQREFLWNFFKFVIELKKERNTFDFEDMAWRVIEGLKSKEIHPIYDSILVDEAQDLSISKIRMLALLSKGSKNSLMLLSDENQRIYQMSSWNKDAGIRIVGRTYHLTLNYRTTKQIIDYTQRQFIRTKPQRNHIKEYTSVLQGEEPVVEFFESNAKQYQYLVKKINSLHEEGMDWYQIAVLSPLDRNVIIKTLEDNNIPAVYLDGDIYPKKGVGVCISTLHGCKGLEFRCVFLVNHNQIEEEIRYISNEWSLEQKLTRLECLKYVAGTRAREQLYILNTEL